MAFGRCDGDVTESVNEKNNWVPCFTPFEKVQPLSAGMLTRQMWRWLKLREHVSRGKLETTIVARVNMAPRRNGNPQLLQGRIQTVSSLTRRVSNCDVGHLTNVTWQERRLAILTIQHQFAAFLVSFLEP